jgi:uncharacterized protein involved in outer membrane biogenesis
MVAIAALLLVLFLFRPGVYRLRYRIAGSIGSALGRKVTIDNVHVHFLPRPGFDLEGLIIADNPEFSSEPMVRAQEVSAAIRLRSLLRGRLEIASLSATEPSINLVRNDQGRWNLASLLERSAQIPVAPTGSQSSASRPAFPYLEASHARINFKLGQEKKAWTLTDADVALWQDAENAWGARMAAQPMRTDVNLTDTGLVQVNATWQRAPSSVDTPLQVSVAWRNGQLGQITKLFTGRDRGWRGDVRLTATLSGTPRALQIQSQIQIDDFRRYDIMNNTSARLSADCSARYRSEEQTLEDLECDAVTGGGAIRLTGSAGPKNTAPPYDLTLAMQNVPLSSALQLLRQAKKGLPDDLAASGRLDAEFHAARSNSGEVRWRGKGAASGVRLSANEGKDQISVGDIPLTLTGGDAGQAKRSLPKTSTSEPTGIHLNIGPFPLPMGAAARATAGGWLTASDYRVFLRGDTEIKRVYRLADTFGMPGFRPVADGSARVDLSVSGSWQGFQTPTTLGTAQLHNVRTGMRGLNPAIEIAAATLTLDRDAVSLEKLSAQVGDTHWSGTVRAPRHCGPGDCVFRFDLAADQLSSAGLSEWFTPHPAKRPWYRILSLGDRPRESPLLAVQADGRVRVHRLSMKSVDATQLTAEVGLDHGKVTLGDLNARIFQGTHRGSWVVDASAQPIRYKAAGVLQGVSLAQVGAAMNDPWITGTTDAKFDLTATGLTFHELVAHADGQLKFVMQNGTFTHLGFPEMAKPFPVHLFAARLQVKNGVWNLTAGRIESHDGIYHVSGTASAANGLNLVLTRGDDQSWNITGTLLKPRSVRAARTEARTVVKP